MSLFIYQNPQDILGWPKRLFGVFHNMLILLLLEQNILVFCLLSFMLTL